MHSILRETAELFTTHRPSAVLANWDVPDDWRSADVMPVYKGWVEDLESCRTVSLTSAPGKTVEKIILSATTWQYRTAG